MEILAVLIPLSIILIGIAGVMFLWAVDNDQFDQLDRHGFDIFDNDAADEPRSKPASTTHDHPGDHP